MSSYNRNSKTIEYDCTTVYIKIKSIHFCYNPAEYALEPYQTYHKRIPCKSSLAWILVHLVCTKFINPLRHKKYLSIVFLLVTTKLELKSTSLRNKFFANQ